MFRPVEGHRFRPKQRRITKKSRQEAQNEELQRPTKVGLGLTLYATPMASMRSTLAASIVGYTTGGRLMWGLASACPFPMSKCGARDRGNLTPSSISSMGWRWKV